ncbi:MAG TPA: SxtJ family membrane protein [Rhodospirillales bacterium]|jgi:predicted membrane metal-binding protein
MKNQSFHEDLKRQDEGEVKAGSERAFGMVFAGVFAAIALWPILDDGKLRAWAAVIAVFFFAAGLLMPPLLKPLNRVWFLFGLALNRVVSPLVMALIFYLTVTPIALIMRIVGKDPLRLKFDRAARSYWIERNPAGPAPETMRQQF